MMRTFFGFVFGGENEKDRRIPGNKTKMENVIQYTNEISYYGKSDVGLKRANNEDVFRISTKNAYCLVADGMGGAAAGELASRIFAEASDWVFSNAVDRNEEATMNLVQESFRVANKKILEHTEKNPNHKGMGCTAELLAFSEQSAVLGHVGDSRTYRFRDGVLKQMTRDHSLVQKQLENKEITEEQARTHPLRNVIFQAVGIQEPLELDLIRFKVQSNDLFLLCSDGLTDLVEDKEISKVLANDNDLQRVVDSLVERAKLAGGKDNVTVVVCKRR